MTINPPYMLRKVTTATLHGPGSGHSACYWLLTLECGHVKDPWLGAGKKPSRRTRCYDCGREGRK